MKILNKFPFFDNEYLSKQDRKIYKLIKNINNLVLNYNYFNIFINGISLASKSSINNIYSKADYKLNISDFPGLNNYSFYGKDIYLFKKGYDYIKNNNTIKKNNLLKLNNILIEKEFISYLEIGKKITKNNNIIFQSVGGKDLTNYIDEYIKLYNNGINDLYFPSLLGYFNYIFLYIHPFGDGNGRVSRVLLMYQSVYKLGLKIPCLFVSFFINSDKEAYYKLLSKIDNGYENGILDYCKWFNNGIIIQLEKVLKGLKIINKYIENIGKIINIERDFLIYIYSNIYIEVDFNEINNNYKNTLLELTKKDILKYYIFNGKRIYYDRKFLSIIESIY